MAENTENKAFGALVNTIVKLIYDVSICVQFYFKFVRQLTSLICLEFLDLTCVLTSPILCGQILSDFPTSKTPNLEVSKLSLKILEIWVPKPRDLENTQK